MHLQTLNLDPTQSLTATCDAFTIHWEKGYDVSNAVVVPTIGTTRAKLENWSTINKMTSYLCGFHKLVIKTMDIPCHGPGGINNNLFLVRCSVHLTLHPNLYKMGYIFFSIHGQWHFFIPFDGRSFLLYGQQRDYHICPAKPEASIFLETHTPKFA